jgi:putative ABC transport system permease protein
MFSIASIVLILAIINYINLNGAKQNKRNKETGIRKTIGAGKKDIISLFLTESILVTVTGFAAALIIVEITLPAFSSLINSHLSLSSIFQFPGNLIAALLILGVGILSFNPVKIFNGDIFKMGKKSYLRNLLTIFQFIISVALIICLIVIQKQINFVKYANLGFNKEQLIRLDILSNDSKVLKNKFRNYSGIKSFCATFGVPGEINETMGSGIKGKDKPISIIATDSAFINTFSIHIVKGRGLQPGDFGKTCMINETAYKYFGWENLIDKKYNNGREGGFKVIAVVKDFNIASMHNSIEPLAILFTNNTTPLYMNIRIAEENLGKTMNYIKKSWKEVYPGYPFKYQFYDDWIDAIYLQDEKFGEIIAIFALLAISISCMGILRLAVFSADSRRKEIGIRKVHGAEISTIMIMLNKDFVKLIFIAFVIACPIAWYAANKWLQSFAYRAGIDWWIFALAGFITLIIALATVSFQAIKAATANPVESLRYE